MRGRKPLLSRDKEASVSGIEELISRLKATVVLEENGRDQSGETKAKEALGIPRHPLLTSCPTGPGEWWAQTMLQSTPGLL